jgi:hypothetical protein
MVSQPCNPLNLVYATLATILTHNMIRRLNLEKKIHLILILVLYSTARWIFIPAESVNFIKLLNCYSEITILVIILYSQIFWLIPKLGQTKRFLYYSITTGVVFLILFIIYLLIHEHTINASVIKSNLLILQEGLGAYLFSVFYYSIKKTFTKIIDRGILKVRTLVLLIITSIIVITTYFAGREYYYQNFKGNSKILFIPQSDSIKRISDLVQLNKFKGNVLYIDYWGTHCSPCLKEFGYKKEIKQMKERYQNRPVKFIYIADCLPNEYSRWKGLVDDFGLEGYHMQMNKHLLDDLRKIDGWGGYMPLFILIDKTGNVVNINAERPSSKERLYKQIDPLL